MKAKASNSNKSNTDANISVPRSAVGETSSTTDSSKHSDISVVSNI